MHGVAVLSQHSSLKLLHQTGLSNRGTDNMCHRFEMSRIHGASWCKELPGDVVFDMMNGEVNKLRDKESRHQQLHDYMQVDLCGASCWRNWHSYLRKRKELGLQ